MDKKLHQLLLHRREGNPFAMAVPEAVVGCCIDHVSQYPPVRTVSAEVYRGHCHPQSRQQQEGESHALVGHSPHRGEGAVGIALERQRMPA